MEHVKQRLGVTLQQQLRVLEHSRRYPYTDWSIVRRIMEQHLLPEIVHVVGQLLAEQEESNRKLQAKLNMLTFGNSADRDERIVELYRQGMSRGSIAKEVSMSKWGVSKALRRLSVN